MSEVCVNSERDGNGQPVFQASDDIEGQIPAREIGHLDYLAALDDSGDPEPEPGRRALGYFSTISTIASTIAIGFSEAYLACFGT